MKKLILMAMAIGLFASCCNQKCEKQCRSDENLAESKGIIGLWQQMKSTEVTDEETGNVFTVLKPAPRYKCIMEDGTYYLLNLTVDAEGTVTSFIDHYGTFELQGDSIELEHINTCSTNPRISGITSTVRYSLPDQNTLSMYYNFGIDEGSEGSNEWVPETWKRVLME